MKLLIKDNKYYFVDGNNINQELALRMHKSGAELYASNVDGHEEVIDNRYKIVNMIDCINVILKEMRVNVLEGATFRPYEISREVQDKLEILEKIFEKNKEGFKDKIIVDDN